MNSSSEGRHSPRSPDRSRPAPARLARAAPLLLAAITLVSAFLLLWHLDSPLLWQDEAETANVARNLLRSGEPTPWDGDHLVTQQGGRDAVRVGGRLLWAWHPWPQHALAAAGLALLGDRLGPTAAARLPFALVGLLTVPLLYAWRRSVAIRVGTAAWRAKALVATAIYGLSIAFVLYSRQCRYYPLLFLGGLLALWAYGRLGTTSTASAAGRAGGPGATAGLGGALGLVFYANPLSGVALGAGFGLHALLHRRTNPGRLRRTLAAGCLLTLIAAPWLALVLVSDVRTPELGIARRAMLFVSQVWRAQSTLLPLVFWPVLAWTWWRARRSGADGAPAANGSAASAGPAAEIGLLAVLGTALLVVVDLEAPLGTARYLLPLWPLCAVVLAGLWRRLHHRSALAGAAYVVLLLGTDLFASLPALPVTLVRAAQAGSITAIPRAYDREAPPLDKLARQGRPGSPLAAFLAARAHAASAPPGPIARLVAFARQLERPPRAIAAAYGWESLHFYLGVPVVGPGLQRGARDHLGLPRLDPGRIDLVVPRRGWPTPPLPPDANDFVPVGLGVPDDAYENLPDPTGARFAPSSLPELTVLVRRSLLPPGLASDGTSPAASTSIGGRNGRR